MNESCVFMDVVVYSNEFYDGVDANRTSSAAVLVGLQQLYQVSYFGEVVELPIHYRLPQLFANSQIVMPSFRFLLS